jgi:hypothetical protein
MSELGTYHGASTIMRKSLDWNLSRISMFEVEVVPHSCMKSLCVNKHYAMNTYGVVDV